MATEDNRVARNPDEPGKRAPAGSRRWADYLTWMREDCIAMVAALDTDAQRTPKVPSGWSPLELLHHLTHMEQRWFVWGFLGEDVSRPWGDWNVADPEAHADARWQVPNELDADDVIARLRSQGKRTQEILRSNELTDSAALGGRFSSDPPSLEWICFHVLAEYARHAGQLDVVVELNAAETGGAGSA